MDNSTMIDADTQDYASGQYRDVRHGKMADFGLFATGGAGAASTAASTVVAALATATSQSQADAGKFQSTKSAGGGLLGLRVYPAPTQGDRCRFL